MTPPWMAYTTDSLANDIYDFHIIALPSCGTEDGEKCEFPFSYGGTQHTSCIEWSSNGNGKPWCATKTREDGSHESWGFCDMKTCTKGK